MEQKTKTQFDDILGKKIVQIFMNDEKCTIAFKTPDGLIQYYADGDCCSRSWFQHFSGLEALVGSVINEIIEHDDITLDAVDKRRTPETDCERVYGWTFITNRGRADLDMRNDSNGYYGGSVELYGSTPWRDYPETPSIEIKDDF